MHSGDEQTQGSWSSKLFKERQRNKLYSRCQALSVFSPKRWLSDCAKLEQPKKRLPLGGARPLSNLETIFPKFRCSQKKVKGKTLTRRLLKAFSDTWSLGACVTWETFKSFMDLLLCNWKKFGEDRPTSSLSGYHTLRAAGRFSKKQIQRNATLEQQCRAYKNQMKVHYSWAYAWQS